MSSVTLRRMIDAIAFSGNPLDRASVLRRDPAWIAEQQQREATRFLPIWRLMPLVKTAAQRSLAWATSAVLDDLEPKPEPILLGLLDGVAHFAVDVTVIGAEAEKQLGVEGAAAFEDLRAIAPQLSIAETGIAAQARSLLDWHENHAWCSSCGGGTRPRQAGSLRVCGDCQVEHFPRTNPVAIAAVVNDDACLLGRAKGWPDTMYSALAGFIEPGETLEAALRREVAEESGIQVGEVRYLLSQPWPFPSSLMMGCIATAESEEIEIDSAELEHAAWFPRQVVLDALKGRSKELFVPPALAIAHHVIKAWAHEGE
jgi:NAD+ diphosphatase